MEQFCDYYFSLVKQKTHTRRLIALQLGDPQYEQLLTHSTTLLVQVLLDLKGTASRKNVSIV